LTSAKKSKGMERLHGQTNAYWEYQRRYAEEILLPLFNSWEWSPKGKSILEIGCSEGGILNALREHGADVTGIEINKDRVENAKRLQVTEFPVIQMDICDTDDLKGLENKFDLIILRDVIEHLLDRDSALANIRKLLVKNGVLFVTFPPWYMPFGGHQQVLRNFLRYVPFIHWLPRNLYLNLIKSVEKERPVLVRDLMDTYDSGLTMRSFRKLMKKYGYSIDHHIKWFLNPAYKIKFGWNQVEMGWFGKIPVLREIFTTSMYSWNRKLGE